ncbi:hypothetical protein [Streptomyces albidoflavus]|uniref:hypothetical protein n=1 Tax=Streptomyces albidoflavus TaxID=1886 RepID=UPI0033F2C305
MIVKQDSNGDTLVISRNLTSWGEGEGKCDLRHEMPAGSIRPSPHPTDEEIAEAMGYGIDAFPEPPVDSSAEPWFWSPGPILHGFPLPLPVGNISGSQAHRG